jgi:hypothetical protein
METSPLVRHLTAKLHQLDGFWTGVAGTSIGRAEAKVKALLGLPVSDRRRIEIPSVPMDLASLVERLSSKQAAIDEALRQQRLKDTMQRKKELEDKLHFLTSQLELLEPTQAKASKVTEDSPLTEAERLAFIKRMEKHRRERDRIRQAKIAQMQEAIQKVAEEELKQKEAIQAAAREKMMNQLKETEVVLKQREKERTQFRVQSEVAFKSVLKAKPRYIKIEEKYEETVLLPKLEEKKLKLAEIRRRFAPMKHEELHEHAKQYEEHKRSVMETSFSRVSQSKVDPIESKSFYKGRFAEICEIEDRDFREAQTKIEKERRDLIKKRNLYGNSVKNIHRPEANSKLQEETKAKQDKFRNARVSSPPQSTSSLDVKQYQIKDIFREPSTLNKPIFKPNPMVPIPKEKRVPVPVDFLGDQRRRREDRVEDLKSLDNLSWSEALSESPRAMQQLISKADLQFNKAKRQELLLSSVDSTSLKQLKAQEAVDEAYLNSMKAKLAVLSSISKNA